MKQIIRDVLDDFPKNTNFESFAARKYLAVLITAALKSKGTYHKYTDAEIEEQEARETWVCSICGKNTFDVDYDSIGSGTNHLGCELERELKEDTPVPVRERGSDRRQGDRREKNWSQKKHEKKVFDYATSYKTNDGHRDYPYNSFVRNEEEQEKVLESSPDIGIR